MSREVNDLWEITVRETTYRQIKTQMYESGKVPEAVIVGGKCQYAFLDDYRGTERTVDGQVLWRGIPLIRTGPVDRVIVVWDMSNIVVPEPLKEE